MSKKICVIGLGYIGMPTAAMFASKGVHVVGVDTNQHVIKALQEGKITIEEPFLDVLVQEVVQNKMLRGSTAPEEADAFIIAVPTPITVDKTADMTYVIEATKSIVPYLKKGNMVILESTSPPGTVETVMAPILKESGLVLGEELYVAHSPERVLPGKILQELRENNRIVGGINKESAERVKALYALFVEGEIFETDATTAEMCKLMENTFRDVNIALANELAKICEKMQINAWEVIALANKHPRVNFHTPGPGVGGHCIAVDPWFVVEKQPSLAKLIHQSRITNDSMPHYTAGRIEEMIGPGPKKITVLGTTYKPDVDDMRESPVVELCEILAAKGYEVAVLDSHVAQFPRKAPSLEEAVAGSSILVLGVNHKEFADLDFAGIASKMKMPLVLDTRNYWNRKTVEAAGLQYYLLGAGS